MTDLLVAGAAPTSSLETRIAYVVVQDSAVQRYSSVFRLLLEANIQHLRSFMTMTVHVLGAIPSIIHIRFLFVSPVVRRRSSILAVPVFDPIRDRLPSGDSDRASSFCIVPVIGRR